MFLFLTFGAFVDSLNGLKVLMKARIVVSLICSCCFLAPRTCVNFRVDFIFNAELRLIADFCIMLKISRLKAVVIAGQNAYISFIEK